MRWRFGRTLFVLGVGAVLGIVGCGAPSTGEEEADAPRQSQQALGSGPDLFVKSVSTSPTSVQPYSDLAANVTVCNQGTVSDLAVVDLLLSADKVITLSDQPLLSYSYVGEVRPGECRLWSPLLFWGTEPGGYVGAIVHTYYGTDTDPSNDARAGNFVYVGALPDFVISSVTGPANVQPGESFTVDVKVCNPGSVAGTTDVQLVLSEDATIRYSPSGNPAKQDLPLVAFTSGMLEANQCETRQLPLSVQPPHQGTWYLGAVADPANAVTEFVETNNTRASKAMGIASWPDFTVQALTGPAIASPGQPFPVDVTVCNQGTTAGSTAVQLVLSEDTTIASGDLPLSSFTTGSLEPGQCEPRQLQLSAQPPYEGPWYLGAIADPSNATPEILETNNTRASAAVGMGLRPDFVIQTISGLPAVTPGAALTVSVTVCNQGTTAGSTAVQLVLSEDTTIGAEDPPLAAFTTGTLEPGRCEARQVQTQVQAPHEGGWYLGAMADPGNTTAELFETNNTRASKRMNVGYQPDFVVQSITGPAAAQNGSYFELTGTVCNQGTAGSAAYVDLYLSSDKVISWDDVPASGFVVDWIDPGQCVSKVVGAAPYNSSLEGAWYLGGVVSSYLPEFDATNNTRVGSVMHFGFAPDYLIQAVSGPSSVKPGDVFTASVTVCNQGTVDGSPDVALVLSQDSTVSLAQDLPLLTFSVGPLAVNACKTQQVQASAPVSNDGTWYLGAIADPGNTEPELVEDNNSRASTALGIGLLPDFTIQTVSAPASARPGEPFTASVTVCNQGTASGITPVRLVLAQDTTSAAQAQALLTFTSGAVAPGQCTTQQVQASAQPPYEGTWYLGAVANPEHTVPEFQDSNNTRFSKVVGLGHLPDFIIQTVSGPPSAIPGASFPVEVRVCNQGTEAGSTDVQLVLTEDTTLRADQDLPLLTFAAGSLTPGQCKSYYPEAQVQPPHEGSWYLGAIADPGNATPEFLEDNNTRVSKHIGLGNKPDFVIQALSAPSSVAPNDYFQGKITVCNQGTAPGNVYVQDYLSTDKVITPLDVSAGWSSWFAWLAPGDCHTDTYYGLAWVPEGIWYAGVIVGSADEEFDTANNSRASAPMNVGNQPDFFIQKVSTPSVASPQGDMLTASVTVCNQGTVDADTEVALMLSPQPTLSEEGSMLLVSFGTGTVAAKQCTEAQVQVLAQPHEVGTWYVVAVADPYNVTPEFNEDNNTRAGSIIGIGALPDFTIQAVSAPPIVKPGDAFTASVTVCNPGTESGSAPVALVLSEDTTLGAEDVPLSSFTSSTLAPGQCETRQVQASALAPHEGTWYLGAMANPGHAVPELLDNNNTRVSKPMGIGYQPDFLIQSVTGPASIMSGQPFLVSATVCNQGPVAGSTDVQLVLSENATILFPDDGPPAKRDLPLASFASGPLAPGQCKAQQVEASTAVPHDGIWYLGAVADPFNTTLELVETNNTRASKPVGVGSAPDLVIVDVQLQNLMPAWHTELSFTACNQGTVSSAPTDVILLRSSDTDIRYEPYAPPDSQDLFIAYAGVDALAPGACSTVQVPYFQWPWDGAPGYLGAVIDPYNQVPELVETNNAHAGAFTGFLLNAPDYVIQSVSAPASLQPGQTFTASVTVCDQGADGPYGRSPDVQLVLSEDASIRFDPNGPPEEQDLPVASIFLGTLEGGHCATKQVQATAQVPHEGTWYLGAVVDPANLLPEQLETNNTRASKPLGIGLMPDYVIPSVSSSAPSALPGSPLTASVTVCNQGTASGAGTDVLLVLSEDTTLRFASDNPLEAVDQPLTTVSSGPLEPGQCTTQEASFTAQVPHEGTWHVGAVADPGSTTPELSESNNTRFSKPVGIGHLPDFIVQTVSGPPSVVPGAPFTVSVTACNQGTADGGADVTLVLSKDGAIRYSSVQQGAWDQPLASFSTGPLAAGQCMTQQVQASTQVPYEGAWYLGAVADPAQLEPELVESNNASTGARIAIGNGAVLVISELNAPATVTMTPPWEPFTPYDVTFQVCNQGTQAASVMVHMVYSDDTDIRINYDGSPEQQEVPVLTSFLDPLEPGQCVEQTESFTQPPPHEGDWYLGALAYPSYYTSVYELIGTTNTRASGLIHFELQPQP